MAEVEPSQAPDASQTATIDPGQMWQHLSEHHHPLLTRGTPSSGSWWSSYLADVHAAQHRGEDSYHARLRVRGGREVPTREAEPAKPASRWVLAGLLLWVLLPLLGGIALIWLVTVAFRFVFSLLIGAGS
jgi:hypothetical protein